MQPDEIWSTLESYLDLVLDRLGLDPFAYLVVTIAGISVWVWYSVITDVALDGRIVWVRRLALLMSAFAAVLFLYGASRLR